MKNDIRIKYLLVGLAVVAIFVMALGRARSQTAAPPERQFTVSLTLPQWQTVANALSDRPFKDVAAIIQSLQQQIAAQDKPKEELDKN